MCILKKSLFDVKKKKDKNESIFKHLSTELAKVLLPNYVKPLLYSSAQLSFLEFHAELSTQSHGAKFSNY